MVTKHATPSSVKMTVNPRRAMVTSHQELRTGSGGFGRGPELIRSSIAVLRPGGRASTVDAPSELHDKPGAGPPEVELGVADGEIRDGQILKGVEIPDVAAHAEVAAQE